MFCKILPKANDYFVQANPQGAGPVWAFSNRKHKNMSLFYGDTKNALNNRRVFLEGLGIDYQDLVCAKQSHGSSVEYIGSDDKGKGALNYGEAIAVTDALVTDKKNLPMAVFTADCLPVFLYAPKTPCVALIHAGWRGTKHGITVKTVGLMRERFGLRPDEIYAAFGPAIRSCCYEVGDEFAGFFSFGLVRRNNRHYLDLPQINKQQLLDSGIKESNMSDYAVCTSCRNSEYFSYRQEGSSCGRMISVIMLR